MEFKFTFADDAEGWAAGFADLPADYDQSIYELVLRQPNCYQDKDGGV